MSMLSGNLTWEGFLTRFQSLSPKSQQQLLYFYNVSTLRELEMIIRPYEYQLMNITEYVIHKHLEMIVPPIFVVLGTIGNLLSFIILIRKPMIRVSTYVFLAVLSLVDTVFLYIGLFRDWIKNLTGQDFLVFDDWSCKTLTFFGFATSDLSVWLIVAVTTERYIAVCYPLKASQFCNAKRAKMVILLITLLIMLINLHFFWTVRLETFNQVGEEVQQCEGAQFWPWIDGIIYSYLPFIVITILNVLIIRQVVKARKARVEISNQGTQTPQDSGYRITVMLLTISFAFLICTLPKTVCMIFGALYKNLRDPKNISRYVLASTTTTYLMYFNHSMNFFLYCATGQKFRYELCRLVKSCCGYKRPSSRGYLSERTASTCNNGTSIRETKLVDFNKSAANEALLTNSRV